MVIGLHALKGWDPGDYNYTCFVSGHADARKCAESEATVNGHPRCL